MRKILSVLLISGVLILQYEGKPIIITSQGAEAQEAESARESQKEPQARTVMTRYPSGVTIIA